MGFVSKGYLEKSMEILRKDLEKILESIVKTMDFDHLQIHMEEQMRHVEDNIERIFKILQNIEEKLPKGDNLV